MVVIFMLPVSADLPKDDLQAAIELSLQESHSAQVEERELNRYCSIILSNNLFEKKSGKGEHV